MTGKDKSKGRRKTKSGCKTCKIRKIKCDENRPHCLQCTSSGRTCDGYGIWSVGDYGFIHGEHSTALFSRKEQRIRLQSSTVTNLLTKYTASETRCFEWFTCRTLRKIPGPFALEYWDSLVVQACLTDPAVMQAVLALGFVHSGGIEYESGRSSSDQELFASQYYSKAITKLQPHFNSRDKTSLRVTLITCVLFISVEYLRGRFQTAELHLINGLKVLHALRPNIADKHSKGDLTDAWIVQAFSRLRLQMALLRPSRQLQSTDRPVGNLFEPTSFSSVSEAWMRLENILNAIIHVTTIVHSERRQCSPDKGRMEPIMSQQKAIKDGLTHWQETLERSSCNFAVDEHLPMVIRLLRSYHCMTKIMAASCVRQDEAQFDEYTEEFKALVGYSLEMWRFREANPMTRALQLKLLSMAHSLVDFGWLPPLFYAATKCREPGIRRQAVTLMESATHREGIWDCQICAAVARKLLELEETSGSRIGEFDITLPNEKTEFVGLSYKFEHGVDSWEMASIEI